MWPFKKKNLPKGSFAYGTGPRDDKKSAAAVLIIEVVVLLLVIAGILAALNYLGIFQIGKILKGSPVQYTNPIEKGRDLSRAKLLDKNTFPTTVPRNQEKNISSLISEIVRPSYIPNKILAQQLKGASKNGLESFSSGWNTANEFFGIILAYDSKDVLINNQISIYPSQAYDNLSPVLARQIAEKYFSLPLGKDFICVPSTMSEGATYCESFWEDIKNKVRRGIGVGARMLTGKGSLVIYCEHHLGPLYDTKSCFPEFTSKGL